MLKLFASIVIVFFVVSCSNDLLTPSGHSSLKPTNAEISTYLDTFDISVPDSSDLSSVIDFVPKSDKEQIKDDDVKQYISYLTNLTYLDISNTSVTDKGLSYLNSLTKLTELNLTALNGVTDKGLKHLKSLPKLKTLDIYNTSVTDAGLVYLQDLDSLRTIYADANRFTQDAITAFDKYRLDNGKMYVIIKQK